ncbi:MAG: hypothetical protein ACJAR2_001669 [Ilumatobacter sp.]
MIKTTVEVFADITCPVHGRGAETGSEQVAKIDHPIEVIVRAWPLEWVNGTTLDAPAVVGLWPAQFLGEGGQFAQRQSL